MKLFSGLANEALAQKVATCLALTLSPREIFIFPDGEKRIQIQESVLDEDVVIIQPTSPPVDTHYLELFFLADAAQRSGAKTVTVVMPYLGYQRQDHMFRDGEAVSLEVMIKTMEATGINRVISFDFHSIRIPEVFTIPVTHLSGLPLFAETIKKQKWDPTETQLVSPDLGGVRRIKQLSSYLAKMPFSTIIKNRNLATGEVKAEEVKGKIKKRMILVDDMISSGKTIAKGAALLKEKGAKEIYVFATHAIFSEEAPTILQESDVTKVFITDTVALPKEKHFPKLEILSVASIIAHTITTSTR